MCGICGAIHVSGERRVPLDVETLDRMTDVLAHRGPNERGTYLSAGAALGARRLSIVDVEDGHQPFANEDGTVHAVQNGELYNHDELRRDLVRDGHRFATRCDTEVLPHLFERHGTRLARHLRGMFAFAVWDGRRRRAVVARDRLGIKPLYYAHVDDVLVFGSELKSVLASGLVRTELDLEALDAYLTLGFVPAPRTPLADVRKLLPGEQLVIEDGRLRRERYWHFPVARPERGRPDAEWADEVLAALDESVRLRLMSDVPLGAMLSADVATRVGACEDVLDRVRRRRCRERARAGT
jgi:asparagine synthase (glutamine-hydrolysing)